MIFGASYIAVWFWGIPLLILFFIMSERLKKRSLRNFAESKLWSELSGAFSPGKRKLKQAMLAVAFSFILLGLMRPQAGFSWREVKRQGLDILIALDTSKSMLAEDVKPNRLERAKLAIRDLVRKLEGDRIGLLAFSGTSFLQCPLTIDYNGFLLALDDVDINTIPVGGTSLANAVYGAFKSYENVKQENKVLIVISDGEDLESGLKEALEEAKTTGLRIFTAGIGTSEGDLIPVPAGSGKKEFLKSADGKLVRTRLVEDLLRKISEETNGVYVRGAGSGGGLDALYDEKLSTLEKQELKSRMEKQYNEKFQLPLAAAFLILLLEPLIGDRKKENFKNKEPGA
ncbi:MAG: VWA domain-containing protein [Candidatus Omnitrophota bacterium]